MDSAFLRLVAQIALVAWCAAEILVLLASRNKWTSVVGVRWAVAGLTCFALWMFLSALSIRSIEVVPRATLVWAFSILELGTAAAAWTWLAVSVKHSFHFSFRSNGNGA